MDYEILSELEKLKKSDMDMRNKLIEKGLLYEGYNEEMQKVHRDNAQKLKLVVNKHGWPGISLVGLEGSRISWLIAQHSICTPELQRSFLREMKKSEKIGDIPKKQVALLTDRILFNEGKPQKYGTVFDWNEKGSLSCEVQDPKNINTIRSEFGFISLEEEIEKQNKAVKSEGGKAPENLSKYKEKVNEWAASLGWR